MSRPASGGARRLMLAAAMVSATTVMVSCSNSLGKDLPPVPSTQQLRPTTPTIFRPDRSGESETGLLAGSTTSSSVPTGPGRVTLTGRVTGPGGAAIPNATVHIERFVGDSIGVLDVTTGADGRYVAKEVLAGRIRVRAWRVPDYVQVKNQVLFATDGTVIDLKVEAHTGTEYRWAIAPTRAYQGQFVNVALQIARRVVTDQGVKKTEGPVAIPVTLSSDGPLHLVVEGAVPTDERGVVRFQLRCDGIGVSVLQAQTSTGETARSDPFDCSAPPTTPAPVTTLPAPAETTLPVPSDTVPVEGVPAA